MSVPKSEWPRGVGQPALRAFAAAGITRLEQLTQYREADLLKLHGVGAKGLSVVRSALQAKGLDFLP